jgi:hypothetical protein
VDKNNCNTQQATDEVRELLDEKRTSDVIRGLARMEDHLETGDGEIEQLSLELWDCWPIEEALEQLYELCPKLKEAMTADSDNTTMALFAGRMFLAGLESRGRKTITRQAQAVGLS